MRAKRSTGESGGHERVPARVLIADDHPLLRAALRATVGRAPGLEVVGEAADGREALELCRLARPDLVLMDVRMPVMDGIAAARAIGREFPRTTVLFLTAHEDPERLPEAIRSGAAGYVLKGASPQEIRGAIRAALNGQTPINREVAMGLLRRLVAAETPREGGERQQQAGPAATAGSPPASRTSAQARSPRSALTEPLSRRELEVLGLMARGRTNQEIARELHRSTSTIKKHARRIFAKLGVPDRAQAVMKAYKLGLLPERREGE